MKRLKRMWRDFHIEQTYLYQRLPYLTLCLSAFFKLGPYGRPRCGVSVAIHGKGPARAPAFGLAAG